MSKTSRPRKMPFTAIPNTVFGESACVLADELGCDVESYSLKGGRPMTTAAAREFLAKGAEHGNNFSSAIWLVVSYSL